MYGQMPEIPVEVLGPIMEDPNRKALAISKGVTEEQIKELDEKFALTPDEIKMVKFALVTRGKNKGRLLKSRKEPKRTEPAPVCELPSDFFGEDYRESVKRRYRQGASDTFQEEVPIESEGAYIWRMLCFSLCQWAPHVSMPIMASVYLRYGASPKYLDGVVDKVLAHIPKKQHKGVLRWHDAFYGTNYADPF